MREGRGLSTRVLLSRTECTDAKYANSQPTLRHIVFRSVVSCAVSVRLSAVLPPVPSFSKSLHFAVSLRAFRESTLMRVRAELANERRPRRLRDSALFSLSHAAPCPLICCGKLLLNQRLPPPPLAAHTGGGRCGRLPSGGNWLVQRIGDK